MPAGTKEALNTIEIQNFLNRVKAADDLNEGRITLSMSEAKRLSTNLSLVLARLVVSQQETIDALVKVKQAETVEVEMDGGDFFENGGE
tara:strand:- start:1219 stop:1485 length:267 start_codon:yes stop_codon:yes gene_type:complete